MQTRRRNAHTFIAFVVQRTKVAAPYTHDLVVLARRAGVPLTSSQEDFLRTINTFNISGRYDDYRFQFYKKATPSYTRSFLRRVEVFYLWLQKQEQR